MGNTTSEALRSSKKEKPFDVDHPPMLKIPIRLGLWKSVPFLPENVLEPEAWEQLLLFTANYGISKRQLSELFLRLCAPMDISLGTIQIKKFVNSFDPKYKKVLRRLVLQRANGKSRVLFEEIVKWICEFCALDFVELILTSLRAIRNFDYMNVVTVRAIVRYISGDSELDEFSRAVLAHLHADPPFHKVVAFPQLCLRYPILGFPIILLQRSLQRRFLGVKFWADYHKRNGTQLLPPNFSKADAAMITARVLMLECVSRAATPFQFGTPATAVATPLAFTHAFGNEVRGLGISDLKQAELLVYELEEIELKWLEEDVLAGKYDPALAQALLERSAALKKSAQVLLTISAREQAENALSSKKGKQLLLREGEVDMASILKEKEIAAQLVAAARQSASKAVEDQRALMRERLSPPSSRPVTPSASSTSRQLLLTDGPATPTTSRPGSRAGSRSGSRPTTPSMSGNGTPTLTPTGKDMEGQLPTLRLNEPQQDTRRSTTSLLASEMASAVVTAEAPRTFMPSVGALMASAPQNGGYGMLAASGLGAGTRPADFHGKSSSANATRARPVVGGFGYGAVDIDGQYIDILSPGGFGALVETKNGKEIPKKTHRVKNAHGEFIENTFGVDLQDEGLNRDRANVFLGMIRSTHSSGVHNGKLVTGDMEEDIFNGVLDGTPSKDASKEDTYGGRLQLVNKFSGDTPTRSTKRAEALDLDVRTGQAAAEFVALGGVNVASMKASLGLSAPILGVDHAPSQSQAMELDSLTASLAAGRRRASLLLQPGTGTHGAGSAGMASLGNEMDISRNATNSTIVEVNGVQHMNLNGSNALPELVNVPGVVRDKLTTYNAENGSIFNASGNGHRNSVILAHAAPTQLVTASGVAVSVAPGGLIADADVGASAFGAQVDQAAGHALMARRRASVAVAEARVAQSKGAAGAFLADDDDGKTIPGVIQVMNASESVLAGLGEAGTSSNHTRRRSVAAAAQRRQSVLALATMSVQQSLKPEAEEKKEGENSNSGDLKSAVITDSSNLPSSRSRRNSAGDGQPLPSNHPQIMNNRRRSISHESSNRLASPSAEIMQRGLANRRVSITRDLQFTPRVHAPREDDADVEALVRVAKNAYGSSHSARSASSGSANSGRLNSPLVHSRNDANTTSNNNGSNVDVDENRDISAANLGLPAGFNTPDGVTVREIIRANSNRQLDTTTTNLQRNNSSELSVKKNNNLRKGNGNGIRRGLSRASSGSDYHSDSDSTPSTAIQPRYSSKLHGPAVSSSILSLPLELNERSSRLSVTEEPHTGSRGPSRKGSLAPGAQESGKDREREKGQGQLVLKPITRREAEAELALIRNEALQNVREAQALLVLNLRDTSLLNAQGLLMQRLTEDDTKSRLAAFAFSSLMGANSAHLRAERQRLRVPKQLPTPIPPAIPKYLLDHPPPNNTRLALSSLQIARLVLVHAMSGAGRSYAVVKTPCLCCGQVVLHHDDLNELEQVVNAIKLERAERIRARKEAKEKAEAEELQKRRRILRQKQAEVRRKKREERDAHIQQRMLAHANLAMTAGTKLVSGGQTTQLSAGRSSLQRLEDDSETLYSSAGPGTAENGKGESMRTLTMSSSNRGLSRRAYPTRTTSSNQQGAYISYSSRGALMESSESNVIRSRNNGRNGGRPSALLVTLEDDAGLPQETPQLTSSALMDADLDLDSQQNTHLGSFYGNNNHSNRLPAKSFYGLAPSSGSSRSITSGGTGPASSLRSTRALNPVQQRMRAVRAREAELKRRLDVLKASTIPGLGDEEQDQLDEHAALAIARSAEELRANQLQRHRRGSALAITSSSAAVASPASLPSDKAALAAKLTVDWDAVEEKRRMLELQDKENRPIEGDHDDEEEEEDEEEALDAIHEEDEATRHEDVEISSKLTPKKKNVQVENSSIVHIHTPSTTKMKSPTIGDGALVLVNASSVLLTSPTEPVELTEAELEFVDAAEAAAAARVTDQALRGKNVTPLVLGTFLADVFRARSSKKAANKALEAASAEKGSAVRSGRRLSMLVNRGELEESVMSRSALAEQNREEAFQRSLELVGALGAQARRNKRNSMIQSSSTAISTEIAALPARRAGDQATPSTTTASNRLEGENGRRKSLVVLTEDNAVSINTSVDESALATTANDSESSLSSIEEERDLERLRKSAKSGPSNTGFCADCDTFCKRLMAELFGYSLSGRVMQAATVQASSELETARVSAEARAQGQPLIQGSPPPDLKLREMQARADAKARYELAKAAGDAQIDDAFESPAAGEDSGILWNKISREIFEYPDDMYFEIYDEESKHFFYYNVTTGDSQWHRPKKFEPYVDPYQAKEEEQISELAQQELLKMRNKPGGQASTTIRTALGGIT